MPLCEGCSVRYDEDEEYECYNCNKLICGECFKIQENEFVKDCICFDCVIGILKKELHDETVLWRFETYWKLLKDYNNLRKEHVLLLKKHEKMKKEHEMMRKELLYRPGGEGFNYANTNFEFLINNKEDNENNKEEKEIKEEKNEINNI